MPDLEQPHGHFLGEGGTVFRLDLSVHETIADRIVKGQIRRVNPDGSPYDGEPDEMVPEPPTTVPPPSANKATWIAWAIACGADPETAEAATKQDLIDAYGAQEPGQ